MSLKDDILTVCNAVLATESLLAGIEIEGKEETYAAARRLKEEALLMDEIKMQQKADEDNRR